ncbi:Bug family tripartite tricarboxylate transporter substrate binding protein [Xanthobacteraceae bacterium A53D]
MKHLVYLILGLLICWQGPAWATYPDRPITLIVPFAAGSATDNITRALASRLSSKLGVAVVVDNRPGANGIIGTTNGAKAVNDGYTLVAVTGTTIAQNPWMFKRLSYDPLVDFEPIARLGGFTLAILVRADSPYNTYDDLIQAIKAKADISYATSYGMQTVCGQTVGRDAGGEVLSVPYKSSPQSILDLMGGTFTFVCSDLATGLGSVISNKTKALAVLMPEGSRYLPNVSPVQKTWPSFPPLQSWVGVVVPKGVAPDRMKILSDAINEVAKTPEFAQSLESVGFEPKPMEAVPFGAYMKEEHQRWKGLIEQAGIEPQ